MDDEVQDGHKFETPQPPREKHESKKPEKSSSSTESSDSNKKSKSSSSSSSNHHSSSSSSHNNHSSSSSSSKHHTNHLSSTNNHQSSSSNHNNHHHHPSSSSNHHHHHSEHKDKDHKKSNDSSKSSSDNKHHKSHHTSSSSSSHKTSNSHKRSREDAESKENETKSKKMKNDHEKSDKKSNSSNDKVKEKSSTSSSNGTSSSSKSKKKDHKSPTKRKHSNDEEQEFDGAMGMGFAEALAAFDMPTSSSSKRQKHDQLADKMVSVKSSSSSSSSSKSKSSSSSSSSHKKDKEKEKSTSSSSSRPSTSKTSQNFTQPPKLLTQKPKLDLLPDIVNELPSDVSIPDYRPLPMNSAMKDYINSNSYGSSMQSRHSRQLTEGELLTESFSSQKSRTRVFSGNSRARSDIPKLYEMCLRILTENLDYVECTGGVPFDILRPALEKAKPEQLSNIEYYNPYLLDDSDILWKPHCQRKWKNRQPMEMESWREMYERCNREDEEKLSRLTQNIRQMQEKTSNCVQKTKMAFVDTVVKAPRGMIRKQEQFGTSRKPVVSPAARIEALKNIQPNLAVAGDVRLRVAAGLRDDAQQSKYRS